MTFVPYRLVVLAVVVTAAVGVAGYFVLASDQAEQSILDQDQITATDEIESLRVAEQALPRGAEVLSYPDLEAGEGYVFVLRTGETAQVNTWKIDGEWVLRGCSPDWACVGE